jgi:hypothetical protein
MRQIFYLLGRKQEKIITDLIGGILEDSGNTIERMKDEYKELIALLKRGYSVRNTAKLSSVSLVQCKG